MSEALSPKTEEVKRLLREGDPRFWSELWRAARAATTFEALLTLAGLRRKALAKSHPSTEGTPIRVGLIGAYTTYPLRDLVELLLAAHGWRPTLFTGEYDNYVSEILDEKSPLYASKPDVVVVMPAVARCKYDGSLLDSREEQQKQVDAHVGQLLSLAETCHARSKAEVVLCNYPLPGERDLGAYRGRTLGSDWSFRKAVNLELGLRAPPYVPICDVEFITARRGALACSDRRRWFESKQPGSPALLVDLAREFAHVVTGLRRPSKKVLVLDLDNTLWGGVLGDDGLEGIELGSTSPRGEAFRALQVYVKSLRARGVLLAVASKNDHDRATLAFEEHPEMVLKREDFVAFKANWSPKSDNLEAIATELNLGLDSFVFVDDNPAEVEIVRQFVPAVETILLGDDPSEYVAQLADSGFFEPRTLTPEDLQRTGQYRAENERRAAMPASVTDMDAYLESLAMVASIRAFSPADVPRITQLVNKSNQFNLTTRRRTEGEISSMLGEGPVRGLTVRLSDRFGDHGLIAVVIGELAGRALKVDTWVMSCRVLKRGVEEETLNAVVRLARSMGAEVLQGVYLPTAKNEMVRDLYPRMGFKLVEESPEGRLAFTLELGEYAPRPTKMRLEATS
jgi:FkbH-like protein